MTAISLQTIQQNFALLGAPAPAPSPTGSADLFARLLALQSASSAQATPVSTTGADIAATAQKYLGVPYVFGGEDASGIDCSGLVQRTLADLGIDAPRLVSGQSTIGTEVASLDQVRAGDLIVLDGGEHIVIAIGDGKVIHAPEPGRNVQIADMWFDDSDVVTIRRVGAPAEPASPTVDASAITALLGSLGTLGGGSSTGDVASSLNQLIAAQAALLARSAL